MTTGPYKEHGVSLQRDTLNTPWGFRLQGGKDFKAPLTVQRVFVGSPADGVLHRGDILVSIENHECANMNHRPAQDIVKQAGGSLRLRIRRGGSYTAAPRPVASAPRQAQSVPTQLTRGSAGPIPTAGALAFLPKPRPPPMPSQSSNAPSFGQDYSRGARYPKTATGQPAPGTGTMLSKVQQSLDKAIWQPGMGEEPEYEQPPMHDLRAHFQEQPEHHYDPNVQILDDDYETKSVNELKQIFGAKASKSKKPRRSRSNRPPPPPIDLPGEEEEDSRTGYQVKPWKPPQQSYDSKPLYQPGWAPKDPGWQPVKGPEAPYGVAPGPQRHAPPPQAPPQRPAYEVPRIEVPETPAWAGSLKSMTGVKPWEVAAAAAAAPQEARPARTRGRPPPQGQAQAPVQQQQMPSPRAQAQQMQSPQGQRQMPSPQGQRQMPSPQAQQEQQQVAPPQEAQQPQRRRTRSPQPDYVPVHQPRVQNVHYGPGESPQYQQHAPDQHEGDAKVAHLQYNSPLGLYSRPNVEEVLVGQTAGKPGEGTMVVTGGGGPPPPPGQKQFDPSQSSVLRMLQEQETAPARPPADRSARYQEHDAGQEMQYQGYMDHYKQSPSMHALESNMSSMDVGTSDF